MAGWLGADVWGVWSDEWSVDVFSTDTFSSRTPAAATRNRCAVFSSRSFSVSGFTSLIWPVKLWSVVSRSAGILAVSLEATGDATDLPFGVSGAPADPDASFCFFFFWLVLAFAEPEPAAVIVSSVLAVRHLCPLSKLSYLLGGPIGERSFFGPPSSNPPVVPVDCLQLQLRPR